MPAPKTLPPPLTAEQANAQLVTAVMGGNAQAIERLSNVRGINPNQHVGHGNGATALMFAAAEGHDEVVGALLGVPGIHVNAKNIQGDTALTEAAVFGHVKVVNALLQVEGINIHARERHGQTALMLAGARGHNGIADILRQARDQE